MKSNFRDNLRKRLTQTPALVIFVLALALTAAATYFSYLSNRIHTQAEADEAALRVSTAIDMRLKSYEGFLKSTRNLFLANPNLRAEEFALYVDNHELTQDYPGLVAVSFVKEIKGSRVTMFSEFIQNDSHHLSTSDQDRDQSISRQKNRAMDLARDQGRILLSEPFSLERAAGEKSQAKSDFVLVAPVLLNAEQLKTKEERRANLLGFVLLSFQADVLFQSLLTDLGKPGSSMIFEVVDVLSQSEQAIFSPQAYGQARRSHDSFVFHKHFGQRHWRIRVVPSLSESNSRANITPYVTLGIGFLFSIMMLIFAQNASLYARVSKKKESQLRLIADNLPALVSYIDTNCRYVFNNKAYTEWFKKPWSEIKGKRVQDVVGQSTYVEKLKDCIDKALLGSRTSCEFDLRVGSEVRHCLAQYIPDFSESGVRGLISLISDITEPTQFRERLRDETRISELVNEVGLVLGSELLLKNLSQKLIDVATELSGANFGLLVSHKANLGSDVSFFAASGFAIDTTAASVANLTSSIVKRTIFQKTVFRINDVETDEHFLDLHPFYLSTHKEPARSLLTAPIVSRSGFTFGVLILAHREPNMFNERHEVLISGIVAQAAVAMDNARLFAESQALNRIKDEFLAMLSHELRTPLNVIMGYSELLKDKRLIGEVGDYVEAIHRNAKAQSQLIADLLDISAIMSGKLSFNPVKMNVKDVVKSALDNVRFAADAKGVILTSTFDAEVDFILGDPTRIQQIVWNLLSNAVKFTPKGGRVEISVTAIEGKCRIIVADTGIGIEPDFLPYVFDRFRQEDTSRTRRFGGLGLGLSIVRHLVEMHGGTILVNSSGKNAGSEFLVEIPFIGKIENLKPKEWNVSELRDKHGSLPKSIEF